MTHKTIINICLTLIALCWTVAIQAQTATVDGINYNLYTGTNTAEVTKSNATGDIVIPEKITVDGVEYSVTSIGYQAFMECTALTSVKMPSVTSIGSSAFQSCSNLISVSIPLVATLFDGAFQTCTNLISVEMPLVTAINNYAFNGCSNLTSVDMPLVKSIGFQAFCGCSSLTSVDMPLVTSISSQAFYGCPITNLSLPASLTSIGDNCFTETKEITLAATTPAVLGTDAFWKYAVIRVPESAVNDYRTAAEWSNYKDQILSMSDSTDYNVTVTAQEKE